MRTHFYQPGILSLTFLFILVSVASSQETIEPTPLEGTIEWVYDLQSGRDLAQREGKPIWIVFRCER